MYRIFTEISGGVTGTRSSYMKSNNEILWFETYAEASEYIRKCQENRSPEARNRFNQFYEIHEG